jgi:hypothetical protein
MKDALGHGSNERGGLSIPDQHRARIRADSGKNPLKGYFLGGGTAASDQAAREILANGPKSAPAPVHGGMKGPLTAEQKDQIGKQIYGRFLK